MSAASISRKAPFQEIIEPLKVGDLRVLEFMAGERIGIHRVERVSNQPLGLGYSFRPVRGGDLRFVYDKDITFSALGVLIVRDAR